MEIQKERVGDAYVVTVNGRLDGIYSTAFANQVGELITGANPKVLIDFTDIDFVTSAGLRALLLLVKKAKATGWLAYFESITCNVKNKLLKSAL